MKKLIFFALIALLFSSAVYAENIAEQRYGVATRQSVAMTIHYKVNTTYCSMAITTSGMRVTGIAGASVGFAANGTVAWSTTMDSSHAPTIGWLVQKINQFPNFEAAVVDAREGDSVMLLAITGGEASAINTQVLNIYFKDGAGVDPQNTFTFQQIRIHTNPGEKVSLLQAYVNGDTGSLIVYKGNTEVWRIPVLSTTRLDSTTGGIVITTIKTDGLIDLSLAGGISGKYFADGSGDLTIKMDNVNPADSWATAEYLQVIYKRE